MAELTYDPARIAEDGLLLADLLLIDLEADAGVSAAQLRRPSRHIGQFKSRHWSRMISQEGLDVVSERSRKCLDLISKPRKVFSTRGALCHALGESGAESSGTNELNASRNDAPLARGG